MENAFKTGFITSFILVILAMAGAGFYLKIEQNHNAELCENYNLTYEVCNQYETCVTQERLRCIEYTEEGLKKEIWIQR